MVCGAVSVCFDIGVLRLKSECKSTELHRQASTTRVQQSSESAVYCTGIKLISTYREFLVNELLVILVKMFSISSFVSCKGMPGRLILTEFLPFLMIEDR